MTAKHNWQPITPTPVEGDEITWDFEKNDVLEGEYVGKEENVGENNSTLYRIKKDDGTTVKMWGSVVLDSRFDLIEPGSYVQITYKGRAKGKKWSYKDYSVAIDIDHEGL